MLYQQVRPPFWQRHPWLSAGVLLIGYALVVHGALALVLLAVGVWVVLAIRRRLRSAELRRAGLRARADYEHRLTLAGDPRGTFGRYPPVWSPQTSGQ